MSELIKLYNLIKMRRNEAWLTQSQVLAFNCIIESLKSHGIVNLYGASGSGKTFLAWFLSEKTGFLYVTSPYKLTVERIVDVSGVIIDNCKSDRRIHRTLLSTLDRRNIGRAILITENSIDDYVSKFELSVSIEDVFHASNNLISEGQNPKPQEFENLWFLISSCFGEYNE
jgi:hypothetical protein